jgi:hypothetical protein
LALPVRLGRFDLRIGRVHQLALLFDGGVERVDESLEIAHVAGRHPAPRGCREARVVFVAVAHQGVKLRPRVGRLALGAAQALGGGVHVVLGEADKRLDWKVFRHRQPP